jgi:hypothetical protein
MADVLMFGATGDGVAAAQRLLNFHMPSLPPLFRLGVFDLDTQTRLQQYQRLCKIKDDGIIGPGTTKALLPLATLSLNGSVQRQSALPPVPNVQLNPSLRELPKVGQADKPALRLPDWFYNRLPQERSWRFDNVQFSAGNEFDIPKGTDSAPVQIAAEFIFLKKRDTNPALSTGFQFSYTPRSDDGRYSGQFYGKVGMNDWPLKKFKVGGHDISLTNPFWSAYVKKATQSPATAGVQVGNESDITIVEKEGSYSVQMAFTAVPAQVDLLNIDEATIKVKWAATVGFALKFTLLAPLSSWTGAPPGRSLP